MSEAFLGDTQTCPETCETKSLSTPAVSIYRLSNFDSRSYRREERVVGEAR